MYDKLIDKMAKFGGIIILLSGLAFLGSIWGVLLFYFFVVRY